MDMTRIKSYAKLRFFDWILCSLIAGGLSVNIFSGFMMNGTLAYNTLAVVGISLLLQLVCFAMVYNRRTTIFATVVGLVYLVGMIIYAKNTGTFADDENHLTAIFVLVIILVNLAVCLVTRSWPGIIAVLLLGNVLSALAAFLEFPVVDSAYIVFLAGSVMLFLYRVYFRTALSADTGTVQFARYFGQIVCICLAALVLALAFFTLVIKPMDPPTDEIKLIQKLERSQIIKRTGIATLVTLPDEDLLSRLTADNNQSTNNPKEEQDDQAESQNQETPDPDTVENTIKDQETDAYAIRYDFTNPLWILAIILVLLVLAAPFVIKETLRKRWLGAVSGMSKDAQVVNFYNYFLRVFSHMDMKKAPEETCREYSGRLTLAFEPYDDGSAADFSELTDIYTATCYGRHSVTDEELAKFTDYYSGIRGKVRKETGKVKYIFKYFVI